MALNEGHGRMGSRMFWLLSSALSELHVYLWNYISLVVYIRFVCKQRPIDLGTLTVPVISRRENYDLVVWGRPQHFKSCWFSESGL